MVDLLGEALPLVASNCGAQSWCANQVEPLRSIELTQSINHERMPVLMSDPADFETWLSGSTEEAFKLARSYAAEQMRIVQSGSEREDLLAA